MLAFRSEGHLERWLHDTQLNRGGVLTVAQTWGLARAYYAEKLDPAWRRRTPAESQAIFDGLGLSGPFWRLGQAPDSSMKA
jgi:hypothetical protein